MGVDYTPKCPELAKRYPGFEKEYPGLRVDIRANISGISEGTLIESRVKGYYAIPDDVTKYERDDQGRLG